MNRSQAFYLFGIVVGWLAHRYGNVSGPVLVLGLLFGIAIYWMIPCLRQAQPSRGEQG